MIEFTKFKYDSFYKDMIDRLVFNDSKTEKRCGDWTYQVVGSLDKNYIVVELTDDSDCVHAFDNFRDFLSAWRDDLMNWFSDNFIVITKDPTNEIMRVSEYEYKRLVEEHFIDAPKRITINGLNYVLEDK